METSVSSSLETEVAVLKRDVASVTNLFTKLDSAIEKIGDLSFNITKMLAVHEERLQTQTGVNSDIYHTIELRRVELQTDIKELHSRITTVHRELSSDMKITEDKIMKAIGELNSAVNNQHSGQNKKIETLEKWRYTLVGAGLVVGFLLTKGIPFLLTFLAAK
jgi:ABC-type phosphate transport system auxiliary subunit